ncbi:beta strand repeat-containing protein [Flavobacterium yafengii]|uniref:beta strand repeat-containing protein n=1 Tax=Flavobacterium yafengii TaxID=3041253 RepID=UPI0024A81BF7|nr:ice-binding family protein [Flavobacterium yafengii]MDI5897459.1 ice-binding family protein [Flavobacterium yafengii]
MKKHLLFSIVTIALLLFSNTSFSQTVNLGILESFEGYTGAGAVTNGAGATWTGDVGTNMGIISGFGAPPFFNGNTYNANAVTAQCRFDLFRLYIHLNDLFVDYPATHAPAFGGGETLTPGVYSIPGAGSIGAALTLDGGGNPNAFFVIKFYGAMTVGAGATINLINGTKSSNVFFIADGAISVAASANLKGTLFSKLGAVGLGVGAVLEGRMLTLEGALVTGAGATVIPPPDACTIPIFCEDNCSAAPAVDVLGVLSNYALYTNLGAVPNTGTSGIDGNIGTDAGGVSGFESSVVIGDIHTADASTAQANIDLDNAYNSLMALPNTVPSDVGVFPVVLLAHAAAFGSVAPGGETINAGVYFINGAGSLGGTLVLDGQNNPNAIFVFKFAGAFSVAAQAKMILINGARRCNVFFIGGAGVATGAISIGAGAVLKGTFLSHGGACGSGASVFLAGRQLSTGGAVVTYSGIIYNNPVCVTSKSLNAPTVPVIAALTDSPSVLPGTNTPSVIGNDTLNGAQAVIGTSPGQVTLTSTPNGPLTMNADGTITVASNTPVGSYPITYTICEVSNPTNCSTVTSNVTVTAPVIAAVTDSPSVLPGTNTPSVIGNDTLNGVQAVIGTAPGQVTLTSTPNGPLTMNADGTITVASNTPAGSYPITYTICEVSNPANCSTVTSNVTVTAPVIAAVTDSPSILPGTNTPSVIGNDTLNGAQAVIGTAPGQVKLTSTPNGPLTMNADGTITVASNTAAGSYPITYTICEVSNPTNCSTVTSNVTVTAPGIAAVADSPSVLAGTNTPSVIGNDTLNGAQAVIGTAPGQVKLTSTPNGPLTMNADGTITVASNTAAGSYPITYTICEVSNPTNCSTVTSNVTVTAPGIAAVTDSPSVLAGTNTPSVIGNDTLNGAQAVIGTAPGQVKLTSTPNGPLTMNADGTITVASNTAAGSYPITYTICEVSNPTNCSTVISNVTVTAPGIAAVADSPSVLAGTNTPSVIGNDTLNGAQAVIGTAPGQVKLTSTPNGPLTMNADGTITVASNTPAGSYPITYTICEVSNPTNCSTVTSNVTVTAPGIAAVTETTPAINGNTGGTTTALTSNDTLSGLAVTIGTASGNVTMTTGTLPAGITVDTATGIVTVAANTAAGSHPITYTICEVNNSTNCSTVSSNIVVSSATIIVANQDTGGPINGTTGETNVVNVLTNDTVNGSAVSLNQINLTTITPNGNLTLNDDGSIDVVPNTPSGTYTLTYQICEKSNPTNCNQAEVSIEVVKELPDFTTTIDIDALVFVSAGDKKDFVVNISEIKGAPSDGQVVVKIVKQSAFLITYGAATNTSNVNGGVSVNNNDWEITENVSLITMALKTGVIIGTNTFSAIGFTIERKSGVPAQTSQPITVTIVNGSGLDSQNYNNTYNTVVKAQ